MRRFHLFELEDQPWFPATIRDLATDYLHFMQKTGGLHRSMLPFVEEALNRGRTTHIVDLCSGGSGPIPAVVQELRDNGLNVTATLTDLYPNLPALGQIAAASQGAIDFIPAAVDARHVPVFARCSTASIISSRPMRKRSCTTPPLPASRLRSSRCRGDRRGCCSG
jgi:hypothetical protein